MTLEEIKKLVVLAQKVAVKPCHCLECGRDFYLMDIETREYVEVPIMEGCRMHGYDTFTAAISKKIFLS